LERPTKENVPGPLTDAPGQAPLRRCDLHVHTRYSSWKRLRAIRAHDSNADPVEVYERARAAGMDFVAITDHDSIEGALRLRDRRPDCAERLIIGEEVETRLPESGQWLHVNVFGVDEAAHREIARRRGDVRELVPFLRERGLFHVLNHPFMSYRLQTAPRAYVEDLLALFDHFEAGNGAMPPAHRLAVEALLRAAVARGLPRFGVAGSDAHVPADVGTSFTLAPGATADEWLGNVARGRCGYVCRPMGLGRLLVRVYGAIAHYYGGLLSTGARPDVPAASRALAALLAPGALLGVPAVLAGLNDLRQRAVGRMMLRGIERSATGTRAEASAPADVAPARRLETDHSALSAEAAD
jgi:predicted metal-dependent phosphoesterase TrpH